MTPIVDLTEEIGATAGYTVRVGPLEFVAPVDSVSQTVGDGVEVVGAALTASDRKPRPLKLKVAVRGDDLEIDPVEAGRRLRRQVRGLLDNNAWRLQGFYLLWGADPDLDGWIVVGGGDLGETDPGITFGEFDLDLSDVYIVGKPGSHRPARRAYIGDRRNGLVPVDSRRSLYSNDWAGQLLSAEPLILPGDAADLVTSGNRPTTATGLGLTVGTRRLWRTCSAADGDIVSYLPNAGLLTGRDRYVALEEPGQVRVWDLNNASTYPPDPAAYTTARDLDPDLYYGWERLYGDARHPSIPLAMDNGACRVIWVAGQGLAIEVWHAAGKYVRAGMITFTANEQRTIEVTPERSILEWRAGSQTLRAILQRGWYGPRLEAYNDTSLATPAQLIYIPEGTGNVTTAATASAVVRLVSRATTAPVPMLWASGTSHETAVAGAANLTVTRTAPNPQNVLVAQLAAQLTWSPAELAARSLVDARAIPVLIARR